MAKATRPQVKRNTRIMIGAASPDVDRKYRAEDALRTIQRADEVRRDAALMRDVKKLAKEQVRALNKVAGTEKGS